jgi:hypothetical protein
MTDDREKRKKEALRRNAIERAKKASVKKMRADQARLEKAAKAANERVEND